MRDFLLLCLSLCVVGLTVAQQPSTTQGPVSPTSSSGFVPVCDPNDFTVGNSPKVPDLPDQFSFTIEGNLVERNSTAVMTEYYDARNDRGRIEFGFNGSASYAIFDYNLGEIFLIPDMRTGDDCRVYPIADEPTFLNRTFGVVYRNGSIHIASPRAYLERLRDDSATRYVGGDIVRGIPTQRWQACYGAENISYLIDYYFVNSTWDYEGQDRHLESSEMVPVQFTLTTNRIDSNGTVRNIYHIYTVVDFRAGSDSVPDTLFQVPNGLACVGRFPGPSVPPVPQFFSTSVERVFKMENINAILTFREFYDLPNKLYRIDVYSRGGGGFAPGQTSIIHDFDSSVQYVVGTQVLNCTAQPLSQYAPYFPDVSLSDDDNLQLVSPNNFFFLGNEFNYSYEGVSNVRGVDVDSWVSVRDFERVASAINLTDAIYEVFFTRPGWIYSTDRSINTDPVPWRIKVSGTVSFLNRTDNSTIMNSGDFQTDYFDFSTDEPSYDAFDISLCSGPDDYHTVLMIIPGQEKGLDFGQLRRNIRTSISNYTGVKPLQIGNIQIIRENGTHIVITFHVSNLTNLASSNTPDAVTSDLAVERLRNSTLNTTLPLTIKISENVTVSPFLRDITPGNRNRTFSCNSTTTNNTNNNCNNNFTNKLGLTDNVVAGVAVGLFLFGLVLGIVLMLVCICCVYCWKSSSTYDIQRAKPVKYERQKDDIQVT